LRIHFAAFIGCIPFCALINVPLKRLIADELVEATALNPLVAVKVHVVHTNVPVEEFKTPMAAEDAVIVEPVIVTLPLELFNTP